MIGLGRETYYNRDGTKDWLRTIVRTVYSYHEGRQYKYVTDPSTMQEIEIAQDVIFVCSVAAKRARDLYYRKTDIGTLYRNAEVV